MIDRCIKPAKKPKKNSLLVTERLELSTLAYHNEELLAPRANQLCHATDELGQIAAYLAMYCTLQIVVFKGH